MQQLRCRSSASSSMNASSTARCGAHSRSPLVAPRRSKPEAPTRIATTVRCAVASSPNDYADLPPPPGDLGLPFIGETLGACVAHAQAINARLVSLLLSTHASHHTDEPFGTVEITRERTDYIKDAPAFVQSRAAKHGPVFKTHLFGKPTVLVGGTDAISQFMAIEPKITTSSLPPTFLILHTEYGALNLEGEALRTSRANLSRVLGPAAITRYMDVIETHSKEFIDGVMASDHRVLTLTPDLEAYCIQMFAKIFIGRELPPGMQANFRTYNDGLLDAAPIDSPLTAFGRGKRALDRLVDFIDCHIAELEAAGTLHEERYFAIREFMAMTDESGQPHPRERICVNLLLMIWGAYAETASLIANMLYQLMVGEPSVRAAVREEVNAAGTEPSCLLLENMPYTVALSSETLRTLPPTGGGFRVADVDVQLAGYKVPAGWVISADPRISNNIASIYPQPERFIPERFVPSKCPFSALRAQVALPPDVNADRPTGAWFPGGIGSHSCPGLPMAYEVSQVFITRFMQSFESWEPVGAQQPGWKALPIKTIDDMYQIRVVPLQK